MKSCPGCGASEPSVEFPPYGLKCRPCRRAQSRADYFLRKEERRKHKNDYMRTQLAAASPTLVRRRMAERLGVASALIPMELAEAASNLLKIKRELKERKRGRE